MHFKLPNPPAIGFQSPMRSSIDARSQTTAPPMPVKEKFAKAAMIRRSTLDPDVKAVALELQMSCDGLNRSRLLNNSLAELTVLPIETVDAAIASLQKQGLIRREFGGWIHLENENVWRAAGVVQ